LLGESRLDALIQRPGRAVEVCGSAGVRIMHVLPSISAALAILILSAEPTQAVFSGEMSPRVRSSDSDYADGMEAWDKKDWPAVIAAMERVVKRRPHHDNAWTRLGYAYRKLGNYDASLHAYDKAITRNPHNRAALEYLGEAYIELGLIEHAKAVLNRLAAECRRVSLTFSDGNFTDGCGEFADLRKAIESTGATSGY
jgi:tetratricopeptide (TPR) repeat protein